MSEQHALGCAALDALDGLVDTSGLARALAAWSAPWRVAVVGRRSVGKSSLVNAVAGHMACVVGLGGVTREASTVALADGVQLIDTPAITSVDAGLTLLAPVLAVADMVLWVVDGLQPLTRTERTVMDAALPADVLLMVVVSRIDLCDPADREAVLERVRALTCKHGPVAVVSADLRSMAKGEATVPASWWARAHSPRRQKRLIAALTAARSALQDGEASEVERMPGLLAEEFRALVKSTEAGLMESIDRGTLDHKTTAVLRLRRAALSAVDRWTAELSQRIEGPLPAMPLPAAPETSPLRTVIAGLSGLEGARRLLRASAAGWLMDGQAALLDWAAIWPPIAEARALRERADEAVAEALLELA